MVESAVWGRIDSLSAFILTNEAQEQLLNVLWIAVDCPDVINSPQVVDALLWALVFRSQFIWVEY